MKIKAIFSLLFFSTSICLAQWSQVNSGIVNISQGARTLGNSVNCIFAAASTNMYKSLDQGINWIEIQPPLASHTPECGYNMGGNYIVGMNASVGCIYYSPDNGNTWQNSIGAPTASVVRGFISTSGSVFAYTSNLGVYRSDDDGVNWSQKITGLSNLNVIFMETINTKILAATIGAGVFVSNDNGDNWIQSNSGIAGGDLNATLVWRMGNDLFYYGQGGGSYTSNDEGATWTSWTKPSVMGLAPLEIHRKSSNIYLRARHFSGGLVDSVFISNDEGMSWTNLTANLPINLNASGLLEFNNFVFTAYNLISPGEGIYRRSTLSTAIVDKSSSMQEDEIITYPNPFVDVLFLKHTNEYNIKSVKIFNSTGKSVYTDGFNFSGMINTINFAKGLYIIEAVLEDNSIIHRSAIK